MDFGNAYLNSCIGKISHLTVSARTSSLLSSFFILFSYKGNVCIFFYLEKKQRKAFFKRIFYHLITSHIHCLYSGYNLMTYLYVLFLMG